MPVSLHSGADKRARAPKRTFHGANTQVYLAILLTEAALVFLSMVFIVIAAPWLPHPRNTHRPHLPYRPPAQVLLYKVQLLDPKQFPPELQPLGAALDAVPFNNSVTLKSKYQFWFFDAQRSVDR